MKVAKRLLSSNGGGVRAPLNTLDWSSISFALTPTPHMYTSETSGDAFEKGSLVPFGNISLSPAAVVLNYGQGLFEGLKATRTSKGRVVLFRPQQNAARAAAGCERLLMARIDEQVFLDGVVSTVQANCEYVPPEGKGALYLRPIVFGSSGQLGVGPASTYKFIVYCSPVGPYFAPKGRGSRFKVSNFHRAAPRGIGGTKAICNYAPVFKAQREVKQQGYDEALFLDATDSHLEEAGAANIFVLLADGTLATPRLGSILPGITRDSIITLARGQGFTVNEVDISLEMLKSAQEMFVCGTAAVISSVDSVSYGDEVVEFPECPGLAATSIKSEFQQILNETTEDKHNWLYDVYEKQ